MLVVGDDGGCDGQVRQHDLLVGVWEQLEQHVLWGEDLGAASGGGGELHSTYLPRQVLRA